MENTTPYHLLARAIYVAINDKDFDFSKNLINAARSIATAEQDQTVSILAMAASEQLCRAMLASTAIKTPNSHSEYGLVQSWFKKNHSVLFQGSSLEKIKQGRYMPDFMLRMQDGVVIPVECKKNFGQRSLRQLQAYMEHFSAPCGIAVACKLSVDLPKNIKFVVKPA